MLKLGGIMSFEIIYGDITKLEVDAIVNAANSRLQEGGGVCGAIFRAANSKELQEECNRIGYCAEGDAVITKGYNLLAKNIIHTVGPVYKGGHKGEAATLSNCYTNSLKLAKEHGLKSIAFPLISSGIFGYPKEEAFNVAKSSIEKFLSQNDIDMKVYLVLFK